MTQIDKILQWISTVTKFDVFKIAEMIRSNDESFSGTLSDFELRMPLVQAIKAYMSGDDAATFERLHTFIKRLISRRITDFSADNIQRQADILRGSVEHLAVCERQRAAWEEEVRAELGSIFKAEDRFTAYDLYMMKHSIGGEHLHLYKYAGDGAVGNCKQLAIADGIVASTEIADLISHSDKDMWRVTVGLYIEQQIALSYFVVTFSYKGNTFILSDKVDYTNPDQITNVRNGGERLSEGRETALGFPYCLIDEIIEKRKINQTITKNAHREIYTFPIQKYFSWRLFYYCKFTIDAIIQGSADIRCLNQKVLAAPVDIADNSHFTQTNISKLDEIVSEIYSDTCTDLVVQTSQVLATNNVNTALLSTADVQRYSQYLVHKDIVITHEKAKYPDINYVDWQTDVFGHIAANKQWDDFRRQQEEDFLALFKAKYETLLPLLFCAEEIHFTDIDHPHTYGDFTAPNKEYDRGDDLFVTGNYDLNAAVNDIQNHEYKCLGGCGCKATNDKYARSFEFKRYTEIITLLGIQRCELPSLYRDYLADEYIPYSGNYIHQNVKPEFVALERDYISRRYLNYLRITFGFCGRCYKKLMKRYSLGKKALIKISSKQHTILGVQAL